MRWVRTGRTILLLIVLLGAAVAWAAEPGFPALTGRVVDDADVLAPDAKARLAGDLAAHEQATGDQVVVATVRSLQNLSIEEFANRLFRHWQLGQAKKDNGVLFLVAPNERKVRIEVGYGLEGVLTDAAASVVVQSLVLPRFRDGDLPGGVEAGARGILELLRHDGEAAPSGWTQPKRLPVATGIDWQTLAIFGVVAFLLLVRLLRSRRVPRGSYSRSYGNSGFGYPPVIVVPGSFGGGSSGSLGNSGGGFSGGGGSSGGGGASGSW